MPTPEEKTTNISSSEFFEAIGKKVEHLDGATNGDHNTGCDGEAGEEKAVEEIESLCMNCHENVGSSVGNWARSSEKNYQANNLG